jgi:tetratricopeptide (TPR) repeat protein
LLFIYVYLAIAASSYAAENSHSLLKQGVDLMSSGDYEAALSKFKESIQIDPTNAQACFFYGAAFNRLGQSSEALEQFDRSLFLATTLNLEPHPFLVFERGLALLRLQQYRLAKKSFEAYEQAHPGRAQTAEFLGRAFIGLGEYDKAEEQLKIALERDPELEPTIRLAMAAMHQKKGNTVGAQQQLISLSNQPQDNRLSRILSDRIPRVPQLPQKPWNFFIGLSGGFNDNAIALGDDQPAGADITNEGDEFFRFTVGGAHTWRPKDWIITGSYSFQTDQYDDISEVNQSDHIFSLRMNHQLNEESGIGINIRERMTYVDNQSFRSEASITPSYWYRFNEMLAGELSFSLAKANYLDSDATPFVDRDDTSRTITPMLYFSFPKNKVNANLGIYFADSEADGSDFDYDDKGIIAQIDLSLPAEVQARAYYTYSDRKYDNLNSISGFTKKRDDDLHYLNFNVSKTIAGGQHFIGGLRVYGQFEYTDRNSSVDFFSFDQKIFSTGFLWEF